jgi:hypothetical protein
MNTRDIINKISSSLKIFTNIGTHYDPIIDNIYWYFVQKREIVNIDRIN